MSEYSSKVTFKAAWIYEQALRSFQHAGQAQIPQSAFTKILQAEQTNLPPEEFLRMRDGQELGFRRYSANTKKYLILVHGSACFGDHFHSLAKEVSRQGLAQVFTLNMRGHGFTSGQRGHAVQYPGQLVEDLEDFILKLKADEPDAQIILGGHSAGGGVVLAFARSAAERLVERYIFFAPFLGMGSPTVRPYFGGWIRKLDALKIRILVVLNVFGVSRFNDLTVTEFALDAIEACDAKESRYVKTWSFNTTLAFGPGPWRPNQVLLEKPILLIAGEADEVFFSHLYQDAFTQIAKLCEQPNVGALGHFDVLVDPLATSAVAKWLR